MEATLRLKLEYPIDNYPTLSEPITFMNLPLEKQTMLSFTCGR